MRALDAFGKCMLAGGIAVALLAVPGTADARGYSVLYSFAGRTDGEEPAARLIKDFAGNLYGTTEIGGSPLCNNYNGCGTVFELAPDGTETVLHRFCIPYGGPCKDGARPFGGGVIKDSAGNLYGTASEGGSQDAGVVFKLAADGRETVLYNFCIQNNCSAGGGPEGGVIKDSAGNLYGTTVVGGTYGEGVVFRLAPDGTETPLYAFTGGSDGANPNAGVIEDQSDNLYGTTSVGGAFDGGVVFKLAPDGTETVLYSFCSKKYCADGEGPTGGVIEDDSGNLYGTTGGGGLGICDGGESCGVVYEIAPSGTETVLHKFNNVDGAFPFGGVIRDVAGNLFGTTYGGGKYGFGIGYGTVFKLAPDGTETLLHSFAGDGMSDGANPAAGLLMDKSGNLYGTTLEGGSVNAGTVFKLRK